MMGFVGKRNTSGLLLAGTFVRAPGELERDRKIYARRSQGATLKTIGVEFGLSVTRVQTILSRHKRRLREAEVNK